ncbi:MAG: O-antigen ligase family protein [Phaeospirillum sp.]|nr:O-antigen ligase family protein [Phaeospirillum sp.]
MVGRADESHPLALAALAGPTLALYAPLGMAPLFTVVAVAALILGRRHRPWRHVWRPGAAILAAIIAWAAVSMVWTIEAPQGLHTVLRLVALAAGGLLLVALAGRFDEPGQRRVRSALAIGVTGALTMILIEVYVGGPGGMRFYANHPAYDLYTPRLGRGMTVCAVLLAPAAVAAWRNGFRLWPVAIVIMGGLAFIGGHTLSAKLSLLALPVVFLAAWRWRRSAGHGLSAAFAVVILAFPLLAWAPSPQQTSDDFAFLPNSAHHRLTIWVFSATRTMDHPLRGWGIEAARSIPGGEDKVEVRRPGNEVVDEQLMPLHPHNSPGQIWLELGGVGALLVCGLMLALGRVVATAPTRVDAAMMAASMACAFIVASVSYGVWQSWWLGTLWLTSALCVAVSARRDPSADSRSAPEPQGSRP